MATDTLPLSVSARGRMTRNGGTAMPAGVLLVDDEASQRSDLAEMVTSLGFQVETAADGLEALEKLATFPARVILTDLVMPRMDGIALLKELSGRGIRTPAIVLT